MHLRPAAEIDWTMANTLMMTVAQTLGYEDQKLFWDEIDNMVSPTPASMVVTIYKFLGVNIERKEAIGAN